MKKLSNKKLPIKMKKTKNIMFTVDKSLVGPSSSPVISRVYYMISGQLSRLATTNKVIIELPTSSKL